ncbi:MAG: hypothetical protein V2B19_12265 [Pseudomonadota bacterium]
MRPNPKEMLQGVIEMLEGEVLRTAAASGNVPLLSQIGLGVLMLKLIASRWDSEGKLLHDGNEEMRRELRNSVQALKEAGLETLAGETETCLAKKYVPDGDYPTLEVLTKESCDLKEIVEKIFVAEAAMKVPNSSLADAHVRFRGALGRQAGHDFMMVEQIMSAIMSPK